MRPIDKFILHAVHNLFPLNEYSEGELNRLMAQFKEEADDLGIEITDEQLKAYIQRFDALKNSPKVTDKDLRKYTLSKLIKLVTSSPGADAGEKETIDDTPDVVYHEEPYIIWNGSKEGNCIKYGAGEKWCITRGSFSSYRYSSGRDYPVFYLAKNNSLSDDNKLSFVAIQVRDTDRDSQRYVYTNRKNSPYESNPMSWEELNSEIPWLRNIPNVKAIMKYIPLSNQEKMTQKYNYDSVGVREWTNFPFETKKQYLVVRGNRGGQFFNDIDNSTFIEKYLPKYPQIANFIAITPGIVDSKELLKNLDKFSNQDRKSITANLRDKINLKYLTSEYFPWDVKKLLTTLDKWNTEQEDRLYVTKDGSAIVRLKLGDNIKVSVHTEEDDYPNVKLNKRTSRFLLDYPELDKIPFKNLIKLAGDDIINKDVVTKLLDDAKNDPNSALIVKQIEDGEIILDSNSFASYKINKNGGIVPVPFDNEEVQAIFDESKDNEAFQQNALSLLGYNTRIPKDIDRKSFISVLRAMPLNKRIVDWRNNPSIVLTTENDKILVMAINRGTQSLQQTAVYGDYDGENWVIANNGNYSVDPAIYRAYYTYLGTQNKKFNDNDIINVVRAAGQYTGNSRVGNAIIEANPPMVEGSLMKPAFYNGTGYIINTQNPRNSFGISSNSGKLVKANLSPAVAATLLGQPAPAAAAAGRRGRPAGGGAPRQAAPAAPAAAGDINVREVMQETGLETAFLRLPRSIFRRLDVTTASRIAPAGDRGAARRNNQLGGRGQVGRVIAIGGSKIYFIRLANGQIIASINVQPGNYNYILTGNANGNNAISLNSPADLVNVLTQRGLAEARQYIMHDYMHHHPEHLDEVRELLRQHVHETKKH